MKKKDKILVTGVAGFIGSKVCKELQKKFSIVGVDDLSSGKKNIQKTSFFIILIYQIIVIIENYLNVSISFI